MLNKGITVSHSTGMIMKTGAAIVLLHGLDLMA